jgi:GNAT superfamily N-acetyltransferase
VDIREAGGADLDLVSRMRLAFLADHREVEPEALAGDVTARTRRFLEAKQATGELRSWVAEDGDCCLGIVSLQLIELPPRPDEPRTWEGYVINMYVRPDHRRAGVGRALFDACLNGATALGLRRLFLHATDDGRPLYEAAGFRSSDRWMELAL